MDRLDPLAECLQKLDWKVLNVELPGFGLAEPDQVWGLGEYAELVGTERQKLWGEKEYIFFGHSNGGRIGIKTALGSDKSLRGLVLCAPGGWSRPNEIKRIVFAGAAKIGRLLLGENKLSRKLLYKLARVHDYEKASPKMREVFKKVVDEDVRDCLSEIKIPTLVLWGNEDRMVSVEDGRAAVKDLNKGELKVYEGEGHRLPYNQPEWVAERIDTWFGKLR